MKGEWGVMKRILFLLALSHLTLSFPALSFAGWHGGRITRIEIGYDGTTTALGLEGWSRNNCTCYSPWPNDMCLGNTRSDAKFEKAFILSARARNVPISVNIDETTCQITALSES